MELLTIIAFINMILFAFILTMKVLIYRSNQRTNAIRERYLEKDKIREQRDEEQYDQERLQERIVLIINDVIRSYEKNFHALPCRIIEQSRKRMEWRIEQLSKCKNDSEMIESLLESLVWYYIDVLIKKDTEEYDKNLKKSLTNDSTNCS